MGRPLHALPAWVPRKMSFLPIEVAELLGCSTRTVRRKMNAGDFGELQMVGAHRRITYHGLETYYNHIGTQRN